MNKPIRYFELIQYTFDNLENREALNTISLGKFVDDTKLTAYEKLDRCLKSLPKTKPYLGWDGNIYPQYKVIEGYLK